MNPRGWTMLLCAALVGMVAARAQEEEPPHQALNFHGRRVVLFDGTGTTDGQYAVAWSVEPKKGSPPVDWAGLKDYGVFRDEYCFEDEKYKVVNLVVDLKSAVVVGDLGFERTYVPGQSHGGMAAAWGPAKEGRRFGLILSDGKWGAADVRLVELAAGSFRRLDAQRVLDGAVQTMISRDTKRSAGRFVMGYFLSDLPELGVRTGFADATTVRLPFSATVPKAEEGYYDGLLTLKLGHGKAQPTLTVSELKTGLDVESLRRTDFLDDPRCREADAELNTAYAAVRQKGSPAEQATLLTEQRAWIGKRDASAAKFENDDATRGQMVSSRIRRDHALQKLTEDRTAELRARLTPKGAAKP